MNEKTKTVSVSIRGESIEVKELAWKDYLKAAKDLGGWLLEIVGEGVAHGKVDLTKEKIVGAIAAQEEIVSFVINKTTGKDQAWIDSLSARDMLSLLGKVIELNLTEELIGSGKKLAFDLKNVFVPEIRN